MHKKRELVPGDEVVIIFDKDLGYITLNVIFQEYRSIKIGKIQHKTPVFKNEESEILGINCFWVLPTDIKNEENIEKWQKKIIPIQAKALELGYIYRYMIPEKIKDKGIRKMAEENITFTKLIEEHGFDPRDESWIEKELAENDREKNWFMFERQIKVPIQWSNIEDLTNVFNDQFKDNASKEEIYKLSTKRARYLLGSYIIRMSWDNDVEKWKKEAKKFECYYRGIEDRQKEWSISKNGNFPIVKTIKPIEFRYDGSLFNIFIEKLPYLFSTPDCTALAENINLRVVSYDRDTKNIRMDFTEDIRNIIKGEIPLNDKPWMEDKYVIILPPEKIKESLDNSKF